MYSNTCEVKNRKGLLFVDRAAGYAVIANKKRHKMDRASKFALVHPRKGVVHSVHPSKKAARNQMEEVAEVQA